MKVVWTEQAWERLAEIEAFVARAYPEAAARLDKLIARGEALARHPDRGRKLPEISSSGLRELVVNNYRIVYRRSASAIDFLNGKLQDFYRQQLFLNYAAIPNAIPLAEMPDYVAEAPEDITPGLQAQLTVAPPGFQDSLKLDAPLAVQSLSRPGFFPFNKFSSVPEAIAAARQAFGESGTNDTIKRLMIPTTSRAPYAWATIPTVRWSTRTGSSTTLRTFTRVTPRCCPVAAPPTP